MKVRFRADNDLDRDIVRGLLRAQPSVDFESAPLPILRKFPALESLGNVNGAIAWRLENQEIADAWLAPGSAGGAASAFWAACPAELLPAGRACPEAGRAEEVRPIVA